MKPTNCTAKAKKKKKRKQEMRNKRGGEKAKRNSHGLCITFKTKNEILISAHARSFSSGSVGRETGRATSLSTRPSKGARGEEILASLFPLFSPETPDTQATAKRSSCTWLYGKF